MTSLLIEQLEYRDCPCGTELTLLEAPSCMCGVVLSHALEGGKLTSPVVSYSLSPDIVALKPQVQTAIAQWTRYIPLAFTEIPDHGASWAPAPQGLTYPAYVRFDIGPIPPGEDANSGQPTEAQTAAVTLTNTHAWTDATYATRVLTHELGHVLGLAHEPSSISSVMNAPPTVQAPTAIDIALVQYLYGVK